MVTLTVLEHLNKLSEGQRFNSLWKNSKFFFPEYASERIDKMTTANHTVHHNMPNTLSIGLVQPNIRGCIRQNDEMNLSTLPTPKQTNKQTNKRSNKSNLQ